ncbi:MAG: tRNA adenosine(34) deaminase TadA [Syntrophobacterales bacterium]|nr:tRNA adenosine(34) deaminase TadA [Syntrophobacterales bacterium]
MDSLDKRHEYYMRLAIKVAQEGARLGEVPVGAVLISPEDHILSLAHNEPIGSHDPSAHAEIVAIRKAAKRVSNYRLVGCSLYVTLEPCIMCYGAIIHARIKRLFFGAYDPKAGAGTVFGLFSSSLFNHRVEITGTLLREDCERLLKDFFEELRDRPKLGKFLTG